ncbi:MAG: TolC family protein [bacterium]
MRIVFINILLLGYAAQLYSQQHESESLEKYVRLGIENNLRLKQKESDWKEANMQLKQAKGLFYPDISFNARYSVADGGRIIEFPVGDLLNPVYSTLNMLTASESFPMIENEEFPFLRPTEHETKLRLVQPLFNTDIFYNKKISENTLDIKYSDMQSYKRLLVFEIKQAYFNYMKAMELLHLLNHTIPVLEENLRVNESLFQNDKVTRDVILRSESEISRLKENIASAEGSTQVASAYFNFLLNRPLDDTIIAVVSELPLAHADIGNYMETAVENREEIDKLEHYSELANNNLGRERSTRFPEVFAMVDYGFQGEEYEFRSDDDFIIASFILKWDLFKGFQEKSQIAEAKIMEEKVHFQIEEAREMIRLEVMNTWHDYLASRKKLEASEDNSATASEIFRMINKKYKQNQASLLEFMDARNNMTMAKQNVIINSYDAMIKYAAFEKAAGLYEFQNE